MSMIAAALGRMMLAVIFILSGIQKVLDPSGAAAMLDSVGLMGSWALPTGIFELVAGLMLLLGVLARFVSIILFGFVALTIFFFHNQFADPMQGAMALKNLAIMGGLLMVFAYGQIRWSYDHWRQRNKVVDAEIRAARAEGKAEGIAAAPMAAAPVGTRTAAVNADGDGVADTTVRR
ncbi:DoxX family protein [Tsuneonella sp. HG222]